MLVPASKADNPIWQQSHQMTAVSFLLSTLQIAKST